MSNPALSHIRILRAGEWTPEQVSVQWTENTRRLVPSVESAIESAWERAVARPGVNLFDGPMCRIESWHANDHHLRLMLSRSTYKPFFGTNMSHPEFADQFGLDVMANPVGVSPALVTRDGFLLLGHRTQSVAYYPGRIHPFSGCMEPKDPDLFSAVARELSEELSLSPGDIDSIICTGVAQDQNLRQDELIFAVESPRTRSEIESRLDPAEHESMLAFPARAQEIERLIHDEHQLTPVAIAALLLWGRPRFGQAWFDALLEAH